MRFPLTPSAFALMLCAPAWVGACEAPPSMPSDACAHFVESVAAEAAAVGPDDSAPVPPSEAEAAEAEAVKVKLKDSQRAPLLEAAYKDALEVLDQNKECSDFLGGREMAQYVLGRLVGQLRDGPELEPVIGIKMRGDYTNITNVKTGGRYRLFDEAIVNSRGPFFRADDGRRALPDCGSFAPNTRGVRAAMLLHELGHLIRRADGRWVLPNDGDNFALAARNTERIEKKCGRHIKALDAAASSDDPRLAARTTGAPAER